MVLVMIAVVGSLIWGLIVMGKGGGISNARQSNKLMQWRIYLQGIALALFALVLVLMQ